MASGVESHQLGWELLHFGNYRGMGYLKFWLLDLGCVRVANTMGSSLYGGS